MRTALLSAIALLATPVVALAAEPPCKLTDADWAAMAQAEKPECDAPRCAMTREHVATLGAEQLQELCKTRTFYDELAAIGGQRFADNHIMDDFPKHSRLYATKAERESYLPVLGLMMEQEVALRRPWKEYPYPDSGFAVRFPDIDKPDHRTQQRGDQQTSMTIYSVHDVDLSVVVLDLASTPSVKADAVAQMVLKSAGPFAADTPMQTPATLGGLPAQELRYRMRELNVLVRTRFVTRGHRVYVVSVMDRASLGPFPEKGVQTFFDSFRFLADPI
ncbi:MAG: hypothetical protein JSR45_00640 [Proteobacteria bacterium]|nr:hypothetical protein [Pseudomonadota bacterium]